MAEQGEHGDGDEAVVWGSAYPPSINAGIPRLGELPASWSRLRMKDMLEVIERPVKLVDTQTYQLVTAKRSRGGIVSRGTLRGDEIKVKQQFEVRSGDFILSNRQIAHGGCGIVPPELDGAVVSGEYTVLHPKPMLDLRFLHYLSHSAYFQQICFHSGVGVHVEKLVFRLHDWLNWQIDIPPLPEQQRIAEVLAEFDCAIEATDALFMAKQTKKRAILERLASETNARPVRLGKLGRFSKGRGIGKSDLAETGIPCLRYAEIYTMYGDAISELRSRVPVEVAATATKLTTGDIVFASSGETAEEIGKAVAYLGDQPAVVGGDTIILRGHGQDASFLAHVLNSDEVVRQKYRLGQGFSVVHIHAGELAQIEVSLPSLERQRAASALLAELDRELVKLADKSQALRQQSRGLMQRLLTSDASMRHMIKEEVAV
ncbi:restriction endonuclease subunit S [Accumulibacter sp.]|uniref:restriction endonuclease subunit S n=1 Tax=Accumulibacter sp. TaxID=2053492 RepID=UPI0026384869|nr:restriction endonuclease subunit S [Accumulibacter sp.]